MIHEQQWRDAEWVDPTRRYERGRFALWLFVLALLISAVFVVMVAVTL
jgi:hypothetical protein